MSTQDIRQVASQTRNLLGLQSDDYVDVVEILELGLPLVTRQLHSCPEGYRYEIVEDHELRNSYALADIQEHVIFLQESVYDNAYDGDPRSRFTLAHEIGHALLHTGQSIQLARKGTKLRAFEDTEWQANTFAAEFLAPIEIVNLCRNLKELKTECGISHQCAETRVKKLLKSGELKQTFELPESIAGLRRTKPRF